jgi:hypothetical protein
MTDTRRVELGNRLYASDLHGRKDRADSAALEVRRHIPADGFVGGFIQETRFNGS